MTEATLWQWLKGARKEFGAGLHMRRMENAVSTGDADVDGILLGEDFAIELKACKLPARGPSLLRFHTITEAQVEWHKNRYNAGGSSCFLLQVGTERFVFPGILARRAAEGITYAWLLLHGIRVGAPEVVVSYATRQRKPLP